MKLELTCVAFKSAHLDYAGLLEEVEAHDVVGDGVRVLNLPGERVHDVDQVVALGEDLVDLRAALAELATEGHADAA